MFKQIAKHSYLVERKNIKRKCNNTVFRKLDQFVKALVANLYKYDTGHRKYDDAQNPFF